MSWIDELREIFTAILASETRYTTGAGNAGGTSLVDAGLIGAGVGRFISFLVIINPGNLTSIHSSDITNFNNGTGEITFNTVNPDGQVAAGTPYKLIPLRFVPAEVAAIITSQGRMLFCMDFWSNPQEEVQVTGAQTTPALPDVVVADLPAGATIVRAIAMFKYRMIENTNAAENSIDATAVQPIQVRDDTPGTWRTAIDFVDEQFKIAATTRESGDVSIGDNDIAVEVDGNDTYNFQWLNAKAHLGNLQFNDVQTGLRIWYSV